MEEEVKTTEQADGADQADWLEGWDTDGRTYVTEEEPEPLENQQEESGESEETQEEAGEEEHQEPEEGQEEPPEPKEQPEEGITIRYMGEDKTISKAEAIILSQKGMNYDAVYQRMVAAEQFRTENESAIGFLQKMAEASGLSVGDYIDEALVNAKMAGGMTEPDARRELDLEKRELAVSRREAQTKETAKPAAETETSRVAKDRAAFLAAFPDVTFDKIPQEVWEALGKDSTGGLVAAYAKYLAKDAQAKVQQAEQAAQAAAQKAKSPGSMKNSNPKPAKSKEDEIFSGWDFN